MLGGILLLNNKVRVIDNSTKKEGLMFNSLIGNLQYVVFSDIKKNLVKKNKHNDDNDIITDLYVVIEDTNELYLNKIKIGRIVKIIGPITDINARQNILLYSDVNVPLNLDLYNNKIELDEVYSFVNDFENKVDESFNFNIYSIDPIGCKDIDDAITYVNENKFIVHIADPNILNNIFDLNKYYENCSSIYLDVDICTESSGTLCKTYHLLPNSISTNCLSLVEGKARSVISTEIEFIDGLPVITNISRRIIRTTKNLSYDEANIMLNENGDIKNLFELSKKLEPLYFKDMEISMNDTSFIKKTILTDTHDMVQLYMLVTNHLIGKYLATNDSVKNKIIYRTCTQNNFNAMYSYENIGHAVLQMNDYIHFTSPIRRVVDYINHQLVLETLLIDNLNKYNTDIQKINKYTKFIKKIGNMSRYISVANKIINGNIYSCKLMSIKQDDNNLLFKWYINDFNLNIECRYKNEFIKDIVTELKVNETYNIKLFALISGKIHNVKIYFETIN